MAKQRARNKIKKNTLNILKPITINSFTEDNDPCFGRHWDLTTSECKRCGDSEICQIVFSQVSNKKRLDYERDNPVKEYHDEPDIKAVKKYLKRKLKKEYRDKKIIRLTKKKFSISEKKIINLLIKLK